MAEPKYLSTEQYVGERYIDTDNKIIELINFINEDCAGWPQHEKMLNNILAVRESNYQTHVLLEQISIAYLAGLSSEVE